MNMAFPPCYNWVYFHGVGAIVFNDEMSDLLVAVLKSSTVKNPMLDNLIADLTDQPSAPVIESELNPSYDYGHFLNKGILTVNRPMAWLLCESIHNCDPTLVHNSLWALFHNLKNFDVPVVKRKSVDRNFQMV